MAIKKKPKEVDVRPFYEASIEDAREIHRAIAEGELPLNIAPIDMQAAARWAHQTLSQGRPQVSVVFGIELRVKTENEIKGEKQ